MESSKKTENREAKGALTNKLSGLLGFAARSRNIQAGYNTTLDLIRKNRAKLVLITEDASEGTREKISQKCSSAGAACVVYGTSEDVSKITGNAGNTVFCVTDKGFAEAMNSEIDRIRSEGE